MTLLASQPPLTLHQWYPSFTQWRTLSLAKTSYRNVAFLDFVCVCVYKENSFLIFFWV
jgi:hypothetical protein